MTGVPGRGGGRSWEGLHCLGLSMANFQARLQPPGSIRSTAQVSVPPKGRPTQVVLCAAAVSPGRAGQEAEAGREVSSGRVPFGPEQRLGVQASDGHSLAPCCLLSRRSARRAWPQSAQGSSRGQGLSPQPTRPGQQKTAAAQSRGHLSSQVVLEDAVLNQKHSDPCPSRASESRKFPVGRAAAQPLAARTSCSGFSALEATLCTGRCWVGEADKRGHPSGDETGPAFRVSVVLSPGIIQGYPGKPGLSLTLS